MLSTDIKESPMIKPSALSPLPWPSSIMSTLLCLNTRHQHHIANTFCFLCINYLPTRFKSKLHGSASVNKLTSGSGTLHLIHPDWYMCFFVELQITFIHSAGASSRCCFLIDCQRNRNNLKNILQFLIQYSVSFFVLFLP